MSISRWLRIDKNAELSSEGVVVTLAKRAQSLGSVNGQDRPAGRCRRVVHVSKTDARRSYVGVACPSLWATVL